MEVALSYNMTPHAFWALDVSNQALMIAYRRVNATMQAYEHLLQDRSAKKTKKN